MAVLDHDPDETHEWLDSVDDLIATEGRHRASQLLGRVVARARSHGVQVGDVSRLTTATRSAPSRSRVDDRRNGRHDLRRAGRGTLVAPDHVLCGVSRTMLMH